MILVIGSLFALGPMGFHIFIASLRNLGIRPSSILPAGKELKVFSKLKHSKEM